MPGLRIHREVAGVVLVYVAYYLGAGTLIPYFPLWLADRALTPSDIALVLAIPAILRIVAAPFFGYVGDSFGKRRVIVVMSALTLIALLLLPFAPSFWPILVLTVTTYICWQAMPLQMDSIAMSLVRRKLVAAYGTIRAFGSTAFITATFAASAILAHFGTGGILAFFFAAAAALLLATTQVSAQAGSERGTEQAEPARVWRRPELVSVLVAAALVHAAHGAFMTFGALHMRDIGFADATLGIVFGTATAAEIVMFFLGYLVTRRLRPVQWIALGAVVAALRWTATAFVTDPALLTGLQLTHALTFSGTYMGMMGYLSESVEPGRMARAQGIYVATFGTFQALLIFAVGHAFERYGGHAFVLAAALPAAALVILGVRAMLMRPPPAGPH